MGFLAFASLDVPYPAQKELVFLVVAIPLLASIIAVAAFLLARSWGARLSPLVLVLGAFVTYNTWSIWLADTPTRDRQFAILAGAALAFGATATIVSHVAKSRWDLESLARSGRRPREIERTQLGPRGFLRGLLANSRGHGHRDATHGAVVIDDPTSFEIRPIFATFMAACAATVYAYLVVIAGAPPLLSGDSASTRLEFFPNGYFATVFVVGCQSIAIAIGVVLINRRKRHLRYRWAPAGFVLSMALLLSTANRGMVVLPALVIALYWAYTARPRAWILVTLGVSGALVFSVTGYWRDRVAWGPTYDRDLESLGYPGVLRFVAPFARYLGGTSETFDRTLEVFPSQIPFQGGRQFFSPLLHGPSVDLYLKNVFELDFQGFGLALGGMNAFYLDWGTSGVIVGFTVLGAIAAIVYELGRARGGLFWIGWLLLATHLILSNYGHPFAYIATIATPVASLCLLKVAREGAGNFTPRMDVTEPVHEPPGPLDVSG